MQIKNTEEKIGQATKDTNYTLVKSKQKNLDLNLSYNSNFTTFIITKFAKQTTLVMCHDASNYENKSINFKYQYLKLKTLNLWAPMSANQDFARFLAFRSRLKMLHFSTKLIKPKSEISQVKFFVF